MVCMLNLQKRKLRKQNETDNSEFVENFDFEVYLLIKNYFL